MASGGYKMASNQIIPLYGPSELEIKDTTDTDKSASYLDLFLGRIYCNQTCFG